MLIWGKLHVIILCIKFKILSYKKTVDYLVQVIYMLITTPTSTRSKFEVSYSHN